MSKEDFLRFAYLPLVGDLMSCPNKLSGEELKCFQHFVARSQEYFKTTFGDSKDGERI